MKAYYPNGTEKIWHLGQTGNRYRLDSIKRMIRLRSLIDKEGVYHITEVNENDDSVLHLAHSPKLIRAYQTGVPENMSNSSGIVWQKNLYKWIINQAWANIFAARDSLQSGIGFCVADGGHHAEYDKGNGFNPINNLVISARWLLKKRLVKKVAILDLDVHFGNGTHSLISKEEPIISVDIWRLRLKKWKYTRNRNNVFHKKINNKNDYFKILLSTLKRIEDFKPDVVLHYLGLDVMRNDRMGGINNFRKEDVLHREKTLSEFLRKSRIPISISIGGGYINYNQPKGQIKDQWKSLVNLFNESVKIHGNGKS